jgi:uncharacterized protein YkwD
MTAVRRVLGRQLVVALVLILSATLVPAAPAHAIDSRTPHQIKERIEYLINRQRVRHGLPRLRVNAKTQYWAKDHAKRMASRGTIYHDGNIQGEVPSGCSAWAENVARTPHDDAARNAMTLFMNSSSHRSNILNRRMSHMGIGVAKRGNYVYIVQRFIDR